MRFVQGSTAQRTEVFILLEAGGEKGFPPRTPFPPGPTAHSHSSRTGKKKKKKGESSCTIHQQLASQSKVPRQRGVGDNRHATRCMGWTERTRNHTHTPKRFVAFHVNNWTCVCVYTRPSVPCLSASERVHKGNLPSIYLLVYCTSVPYPCDSPPPWTGWLADWLADWHRPFTARPFVPPTPPVPPKAVISCSRTFGGTKHSKSATRGNVNPSAHTISLFYRSRKRLIISHGPFNSLAVHPGSPLCHQHQPEGHG